MIREGLARLWGLATSLAQVYPHQPQLFVGVALAQGLPHRSEELGAPLVESRFDFSQVLRRGQQVGQVSFSPAITSRSKWLMMVPSPSPRCWAT